ncbi:MAG: GNAT family N-acetyltransferase [Bacteroidia bacterium]|nr:GNAT family N-acetyltransferase [Bacteroidia bacterium]
MNIIKAGIADLDLIVPLFDAYRRFYEQEADPEKVKAFLHTRIQREESVIFLALSEGQREAMGFTQLYPSFSSVSMQRLWVLNDLFVDPKHRKKGVATSLMNTARELAEDTRSKGLMLETGKENYDAQALYEKLGYKKEEDYFVYNLKV